MPNCNVENRENIGVNGKDEGRRAEKRTEEHTQHISASEGNRIEEQRRGEGSIGLWHRRLAELYLVFNIIIKRSVHVFVRLAKGL